MALSGTLDTFSLPDVMRLLASTTKSGRLGVTGPSGSGSIWLDSGEVVAAELVDTHADNPSYADVLFDLLRWDTGKFDFEGGIHTTSNSAPQPMDVVLAKAEAMLAEWREIEVVVPSMDVQVCLSKELSGSEVIVDSERWRGVAAIGSGSSVVEVARHLGINELDVCRLVKDLVELSLVELSEFAENSEQEEVDPGLFQSNVPEPVDDDPRLDPLLSAGDPFSDFDHFRDEPSAGGLFNGPDESAAADDEVLNPAEMARQLANLSPKAAKAVAEAARATTDAERDAALAEVEAEDETVNRGLLLRFLGSVES